MIAVVLLLAVSCLGLRLMTRSEGDAAVVTVDGVEVARYPLSRDMETELTGLGGTNYLVIHDGMADVTEADCPDELCVHESAIRYDGETIVCLPHKLVVRIESSEKPEVDGVVK